MSNLKTWQTIVIDRDESDIWKIINNKCLDIADISLGRTKTPDNEPRNSELNRATDSVTLWLKFHELDAVRKTCRYFFRGTVAHRRFRAYCTISVSNEQSGNSIRVSVSSEAYDSGSVQSMFGTQIGEAITERLLMFIVETEVAADTLGGVEDPTQCCALDNAITPWSRTQLALISASTCVVVAISYYVGKMNRKRSA